MLYIEAVAALDDPRSSYEEGVVSGGHGHGNINGHHHHHADAAREAVSVIGAVELDLKAKWIYYDLCKGD